MMSNIASDVPATHLLRMENVTKTFQMGEVAVEALSNVSLEIYPGELLVMVGPSGSGKTTMLNIVGGMDTGDRGPGVVSRPRTRRLPAPPT